MDDRSIDLLEAGSDLATLASECELTGRRTVLLRNGRPVSIMLSWDEYMALKETVEIAADASIRYVIDQADAEAQAGATLLPEDLLVE